MASKLKLVSRISLAFSFVYSIKAITHTLYTKKINQTSSVCCVPYATRTFIRFIEWQRFHRASLYKGHLISYGKLYSAKRTKILVLSRSDPIAYWRYYLKKKKKQKSVKKSPDYGKKYPVRRTMQQMTLLWIFRADKCCRMDTIFLCMSDKSG